jgi:hypothetical protein
MGHPMRKTGRYAGSGQDPLLAWRFRTLRKQPRKQDGRLQEG